MSEAATQPAMRRIALATESAELDAVSGSLEELINYYIEEAPDASKSSVILKSTPFLSNSITAGDGPVVAANAELPGVLYVVSGSTFWRIKGSAITNMGSVGLTTYTPPPAVTIASGPTQVVVCVPPNAYAAGINETTLHQITGATGTPFPGASSVAYLDGYFVFTTADNTSEYFWSGLFDPSTLSALAFAYADAVPNVVRRVISYQGYLWFLGEAGIEVQYDCGNLDDPFQRVDGGLIPYGVMSANGVTIADGSIFWLGADGIVFRTEGLSAVRVSTNSIEQRILDYFGGSGTPNYYVYAMFSFVEDGHTFVALTLQKPSPTLGITFVYDCLTKRWHRRSSSIDGTYPWRVNCAVLSGNFLFGDTYTGALFYGSNGGSGASGTTDGGAPRKNIAVLPPVWNGTRRGFMDRLEVECDLGGSALTVDWTDDAGTTWKGERSVALTGKRAVTTRLGSFRERSIRITTAGESRVLGVDCQIRSGSE